MPNILFVCSQNRLRSPTAEHLFSGRHGIQVASAGLSRGADEMISRELVEWADIIFVMEKVHRRRLTQRFQPSLRDKRIICLDIPDNYSYMQPELVELLERKVSGIIDNG